MFHQASTIESLPLIVAKFGGTSVLIIKPCYAALKLLKMITTTD